MDTAGPGCGGGETRQYKDSGTRQWMASLGLYAEAVALFQHFLMAYYTGADRPTGFPEGGGGGREDVHKHTHPLNIVRVTSSALQKIEKHPHSWTFTSTPPPLDIARMTSSTFRGGGGGVIGPGHARTLCCIGYSINITRSQRT